MSVKDNIGNVSVSITDFNNRDEDSFGLIYSVLYKELNLFASKLFQYTEVDSQDLVQDLFLSLWEKRNVSFDSFDYIKNYLYKSIKNYHKNYLRHNTKTKAYTEYIKTIDDFYYSTMVEVEVVSLLSIAEKVLPAECCKTFKLYMEGYDTKEIAKKLNKSVFTIYNQRTEAINTLRKHIKRDELLFILTFFH